MNNWRLLLLALVAVVQPIASFAERNFDGRHQCCDHQSRPLLRDSLDGTYQIATTTEESRLNQGDEIREDRRHEIKHQGLASSRQSSDTSLLRSREIDTRKTAPRESRLQRIANDHNRERILSREERRIVRTTGDIKRDEQNSRVVREYRGQNDRVPESSRKPRGRDVSRTRRGDERISEYSPNTRREIRRQDSQNRESRNVFRRTRHIANTREDALKNRRQVQNRSDMVRRERSVNGEVRRSVDNNNERRMSERRTSENMDTRLFSQDTRPVNEVSDIRARHNSREDRRGKEVTRLRTARFDERRQHREEFRDRTNSIPRLSRDKIKINEGIDPKSALVSRITDDAKIPFERNRENQKELRTDERSFKENRDERFRANLRIRGDGRLSKQRTIENRREIRNDVRHVRDVRDMKVRENINNQRRENREARDIENRRVGDSERRSREKSNENKIDIRGTKAIRESHRELRDNERRFRERNTEIRGLVRSAEPMAKNHRDIREERRYIDKTNENRRQIRDNEGRVRERNSEVRREIRSAERMTENHREIKDDESVRGRNSESRREIRSVKRINEIRDNERRIRERNSESRKEIRSVERMAKNHREIRDESRYRDTINENRRQIRDNERRVRETNNEVRREIRSAERMNDISDNGKRVRESESRREIRSAETIRETRDNERRLRENRNIARRSIEYSDDIRNSRKEIRDDERRYRSKNTESRIDTRRDNARRVRNNAEVSRAVRNSESQSRETTDAIMTGNRREINNIRDLREIRDKRSTNGRRLETRASGALQRDNLVINRRVRSTKLGDVRDKAESRLTRSVFSREREISRLPIKFLNNDETMDKETVDTRFRNVESANNLENSVSETQKENESVDETVIANWQYVFYTLQAIYLCGLLMQMLTPKASEKLKTGNWWHLNSQRLIKVD